jgi:hypothetical protein
MTMEWLEVEVVNWNRYNPRTDRKNHTWFRLQNDILTEPKLFGLTSAQKFAVVCLFAEVSKAGGKRVRLSVPWFCSQLKMKQSELLKVNRQLIDAGILMPHTGDQSVSILLTTDGTDGTDERTDGHDDLDFDGIWKKWPRRVNKTEARYRFERLIKTQEEYRDLEKAIENYKSDIAAKGTEEKYIKHMASFLGTEDKQVWRDWINPEASGSAPQGPDLDSIFGGSPGGHA